MIALFYITNVLGTNKILARRDSTSAVIKRVTHNKYIVQLFREVAKYVILHGGFLDIPVKNNIDATDKLELMSEFVPHIGKDKDSKAKEAKARVKSVVAFDTVYFMLEVFTEVLRKIRIGYSEAVENMKMLGGFASTLQAKMDILVFLIFFKEFPIVLRENLITTLKIRKDNLNGISTKCDSEIVDSSFKKLCNVSYREIKISNDNPVAKYLSTHKYVKFDSEAGFVALLFIVTRLREFSSDILV